MYIIYLQRKAFNEWDKLDKLCFASICLVLVVVVSFVILEQDLSDLLKGISTIKFLSNILCELLGTTSPQKCSDKGIRIPGNPLCAWNYISQIHPEISWDIMRYPGMCQRKQMLNFSPCEIRFQKKTTLASLCKPRPNLVGLGAFPYKLFNPKTKNPWKTGF